jgi:hypothetical protein
VSWLFLSLCHKWRWQNVEATRPTDDDEFVRILPRRS